MPAPTCSYLSLATAQRSSQHDKITDFTAGTDDIDLSPIDAISGAGGIDLFNFIATAGFSGSAGQLNYFYNSSLGVTTLQGDTDGDKIADFAIDLTGNIGISLSDLIGAYGVPVVVESFGSTTFVQVGGNYFLYANGTSSGPSLKSLELQLPWGSTVPAGHRLRRSKRGPNTTSCGRTRARINMEHGAPTSVATTPQISLAQYRETARN